MLAPLILAAASAPAEANRTTELDGVRCLADHIAFDGACRALGWFDGLTRSGWTLEAVVGCDTLGDCAHAMIVESEDGGTKVRAVVLAEDVGVASIHHRDGYPTVARIVHTDEGDALTTKVVELDGAGSTVLFDGPAGTAPNLSEGSGSEALQLADHGTGNNFEEIKWTLHLGGQDLYRRVGADCVALPGFKIQMGTSD